MPLCMHCVSFVGSVVIESRALKPCCVSDGGMYGVIVLRISLSRNLTGLHNNEIDLYLMSSVGVLFCLSMCMILAFVPDVWNDAVHYYMVKDVSEGPYTVKNNCKLYLCTFANFANYLVKQRFLQNIV